LAAVRDALDMLIIFPPDHFLFAWTGHGGENGIALADGILTYDELAYRLGAIDARVKVAIFSTCHAGAARRQFETRVAGATETLVDRGETAAREVELGPVVDGLRVIRSGVSLSDRVIIDGVQHARPGKPVTVKAGQIAPSTDAPTPPVAPTASSATFAISP